ncbi:hypothetical protein C7974DRAFT_440467 [Boeremia exigua]|uniref:uncharacterized protein n=1 Tax=Boeremia exigua TaxID=749465 RepID=UPI001E8E39B1|nr:uncharacterized protein C7974DRAFT_440467 [Boeremia exigua]KAH6644859.1 hypothetical protein C7974DRAFT_440467 [Boeremia exigua]
MPPFKNVLLIGASGNLGTALLTALLPSQYRVTPTTPPSPPSPPPCATKDVVISTIGGAIVGDQNRFIDAALAAGVTRFIPSEFGPDTLQPGVHEVIPSLPAKLSTVQYLRTKEGALEWTSVITGVWLDWALTSGLFAFDVQNKVARVVDRGATAFTGTLLAKVAKAVLAILDRPQETRNRYVYISSFTTTQNEVLAAFERVDGRKWSVVHENSEDILATGRKMVQQGDYGGTMHLVRYIVTNKAGLGLSPREKLWDERLGLEEDDLEQMVRDIYSGR